MPKISFACAACASILLFSLAGAATAGGLFTVDYQSLVSRADLVYSKPVERSEEGMPVGNGRMGSLVWTTSGALKMQVNRADVFAMNRSTNSFARGSEDYASGCGYVDINFMDYGEDVFGGKAFRQHLSVYDGLMTAQGAGVTARVLAWHERDVIAIEIEDQREKPSPISVDLRMLRYAMQYIPRKNFELSSQHAVMIQTREHTAASRLDIQDGRILLTQEFREGDYFNASGLAAGIIGRDSKAQFYNDLTVRLTAAPGKGKFTIFIASASTFDAKHDPAVLALLELNAAQEKGFEEILFGTRAWWRNFWSKAFVRLNSEDEMANFVELNYTYYLYIMASSSRGAYMPRFGGMIWYTTGDMREWGSEYWWHNQSCYYDALPPANRFELMDPMFATYSGMYESCATAAQQQWGSQGLWIPETTWFDGLEKLPDDIAGEMKDLYLLRKPWEQRSEKFQLFAEPKQTFNSRWNWMNHSGKWEHGRWISKDKGAGPFGHVTHIFSTTAKIAYLYWLRYEYTMDKAWLRDRAYPMIKGAVEFYRNFPNTKKGADGKYHIHHVNNHEPVWDAQDAQEEIAAMRGMTPIAIRASEILDADPDLRALWKEFAANLAPLPTSDQPTSGSAVERLHWISALPPARKGRPEQSSILPAMFYDLCAVETEDAEMVRIANATFEAMHSKGFNENTPVSTLSKSPTAAAHLGRANDLKYMIPNQLRCLPPRGFCDVIGSGADGVMPNRLSLREGPGAIDGERLGRASEALHEALLQSAPPAPGKAPIIHVFPAWPKEWDAQYTLGARGGFLVSASMEQGRIEFVEIQAQVAGGCRLRNPWGSAPVTLYRDGKAAEEFSGSLLQFPTAQGESIVVVPMGSRPSPKKVS